MANSPVGFYLLIFDETFTFMFKMKVVCSWHVLFILRAPEMSSVTSYVYGLSGTISMYDTGIFCSVKVLSNITCKTT